MASAGGVAGLGPVWTGLSRVARAGACRVTVGRYLRWVSVPATVGGVSVEAWVQAPTSLLQLVEVVGGEFVVKRVGGNPHHYLARRLAEEFERQWPGTVAVAPGNWGLRVHDGRVQLGRVPDVLVDGDALLTEPVFAGVPDAAVEVWSPSNTLGEMNAKRQEYRDAGLPVLVEAYITDSGDVRLEWLRQGGGRWDTIAVATGDNPLEIPGPRPFRVLPNGLLRRST
jgi:Uma2 family endonuclease